MFKTSDELLARNFNQLVSHLERFFTTLMSEDSFRISSRIYELYLKSLQQYNRFIHIGCMPYFSRSSSRINDYVLNYLRIHFKWLVKRIRELVSACYSDFTGLVSIFLPIAFPNKGEYCVWFDLSDLTLFLCSTIFQELSI